MQLPVFSYSALPSTILSRARHLMGQLLVLFILTLLLACGSGSPKTDAVGNTDLRVQHVNVFYEKDKFAGWPANWGMWNWGNEVLVGYTLANHKDTTGHNYDVSTSVAQFSRSLDGGLTWTVEDAYAKGITEGTFEHNIGNRSVRPRALTEAIQFQHPDFALTFRMRNAIDGGTSFYYTYNRGQKWEGPFDFKVDFPGSNPSGIVSRTDYLVEDENSMMAFLTVGFGDTAKNWRQVACVRTDDGGISWQFLSWIGEPGINSIMPSSIRLSENKLLTFIRRTKPPRMVSFLSDDNGKSWKQLDDPVVVDANGHPPALLKLNDGRLCLVYGIRKKETMETGIGMYAVFSSDEGQTWSKPSLIQGNDGGTWDIGYPRALQLPDGKVLATYYYNKADKGDKFRYISGSIFNPADFVESTK